MTECINNIMYQTLPNIILGFHGCDIEVYNKVLHNKEMLFRSCQDYEWLGSGIYFWENNIARAWEWANRGDNEPAVIGAIIDLGYCLDLLDSSCIEMLSNEYKLMEADFEYIGKEMPKNENRSPRDKDFSNRRLDCAVIEHLHSTRSKANETPFDSVRGMFVGVDPIYPGASFYYGSHIQICVRNPNCIKGFFSPREFDNSWRIV